jgi:hypothetical protein
LGLVYLPVKAVLGHEFAMCTPFHHLAILKHQDQVCVSDYGQAMGDDESCASLDDRT